MKRNDVVALTTSLVVHVLVLFLLSMTTIGAQKYDPIGYIEVDFGPLAEGRPVQQSVEDDGQDTQDLAETVEDQTPQQQSAPDEARPVDLPDEADTRVEETISTPEVEEISPEVQTNPRTTDNPEPQREVIPATPRRGGNTGGTSGSETGDDGAGTDAEASAPFQIEGLNRTPVMAPPPPYSEKVNALIKVRITVDPRGRVIRQIPLLKGNPSLEQAVLETLREWRFNPLPPNAPQENQTGVVTFRFRLE
jgi:protein TonB